MTTHYELLQSQSRLQNWGPPLTNGEKSAPSPPCIAVAVNIDVQYVYLLYSLRELIEPLPQADN